MKRISVFTIVTVFLFSLFIQPVYAKEISFKDVNKSNSHYDGIQYLSNNGILNGYSDNTFRPDNTITRSQTAVLFTRAMDLTIPSNVSSILRNYSDISIKHDYADAIAATYNAGIFTGNNGKFNDGSLTREQMATVIVRAYGLEDTGKNVNANLSNIDPSHRENVKILFQHNITNQAGDFRPRQSVTRGQFATFLYRVMDNQDSPEENEEPEEEVDSDTKIVHNEKELAEALSYGSTYKIVELGNAIELTDTIRVRNKGVQIKGYSNGMNYGITGSHGKTVFEVDTDNVHFDQVRIYPENSTAIHVVSGELFKFTKGFISSNDNASNGIIVEDNYKPIDDDGNFVRKETAIIKDSMIDVPKIGVSFTGGLLYLEDNTIENALTGLKFTAVEDPQSIKGNIFLNNHEDIYIDWLPSIEKFLPLNHFDGTPKINVDSEPTEPEIEEPSITELLKIEYDRHHNAINEIEQNRSSYISTVKSKINEIKRESPVGYWSDYEYNKIIRELQNEIGELHQRITLLALDNSYEAQAERARLEEELIKVESELEEVQIKRGAQLQIRSLEDMLSKYEIEYQNKINQENKLHESNLNKIRN